MSIYSAHLKHVEKSSGLPKFVEEVFILPGEIPFYIILLKYQFENMRRHGIDIKIPTVLVLGDVGIGKSAQIRLAANLCAEIKGKIFVDLASVEKYIKSGDGDATNNPLNDILNNPDKYFLFLDLRLSTIEPYDLQGIIREIEINGFSERVSKYVPFLWTFLFTKCEGILFLDELTHVVREDILSATYQITYDHKIGDYAFHENVMVIAAGNLPHQTSVARPLDSGLLNRSIIFYVKNTPEAFLEYMRSKIGRKNLIKNTERYVLGRLKKTLDDSSSINHRMLQRMRGFVVKRGLNSRKRRRGFVNFLSPRTLEWFIFFSNGVKDSDVLKRIAVGFLGEDGMEIIKILDPNLRKAYRQKVRRMRRLLDSILRNPKRYVGMFSDIEKVTEFFEILGEELNRLCIEGNTAKYRNLLQKTVDMLKTTYEFRDHIGMYTDIISILIKNIREQVVRDLVKALRERDLDYLIKYLAFLIRR